MTFCKSFKNMCFNQGMYVSVTEAVHQLSSGKASSLDGLTGESLKYANHILSVLLSGLLACLNTVISQLACLIQL